MMTRLCIICYFFIAWTAAAQSDDTVSDPQKGPEKLAKLLDTKHDFIVKCFQQYQKDLAGAKQDPRDNFVLAVSTDERSYLTVKSLEDAALSIDFNNCLRRILEKEQVQLGYYGKWHYYRFVPDSSGYRREYSDKIDRAGLKADEIVEVIRKHLGPIRECYEKHLEKHPRDQGKISMRWVVSTSGKATQVEVVSTQMHESLSPCVVDKVRKMVFPQPRGGKPVNVNYPFTFVPG